MRKAVIDPRPFVDIPSKEKTPVEPADQRASGVGAFLELA
jgi:hypothetical protein